LKTKYHSQKKTRKQHETQNPQKTYSTYRYYELVNTFLWCRGRKRIKSFLHGMSTTRLQGHHAIGNTERLL